MKSVSVDLAVDTASLTLLMLPQAPRDDPQKRQSCTRKADNFINRMVKVTRVSFQQKQRTS